MTFSPVARLSLSSNPQLILIDGHNLLFALRERFAGHLVDGHPGSAAREALVETMREAFSGSTTVVRIYFDGSTANTERRSEQVEVIYPGGTADQCADWAILRDLAQPRSANLAGTATVITRDIQLARRARKRGAAVEDPVEFFGKWIDRER